MNMQNQNQEQDQYDKEFYLLLLGINIDNYKTKYI